MELIEVDLGRIPSSTIFRIYPLGDIHAGSVHCAEGHIRRMVKQIQRDPLARWIGMGDYADAITKEDKRFDIGGLSPWVKPGNIIESQRRWVTQLFDPIKEQCLAFLTGNHEESIHRHHQDDLARNIADDLGVPYAGFSCFILLKACRGAMINRRLVRIHAWHGAGAAQSEGARIMRLMRLVNEVEADICIMGHLHAVSTYETQRLICDGGLIQYKPVVAAMTGSWLKTYTQGSQTGGAISYGEMKGYKPSVIGCPIVNVKMFHGTESALKGKRRKNNAFNARWWIETSSVSPHTEEA